MRDFVRVVLRVTADIVQRVLVKVPFAHERTQDASPLRLHPFRRGNLQSRFSATFASPATV